MALNNKNSKEQRPDVVILCGGLGTRLKSVVADKPKSLADIGAETFLDILLKVVFSQGFSRVVLAIGHKGEKIVEKYSGDPRITFSLEEYPLGTGGAVIKAMNEITTEDFVVMNGDSLCNVDLVDAYETHKKCNAFASIVLGEASDISDYGSIRIDENNRILSFAEKISEKRNRLINAGVYIFSNKIINHAPKNEAFSLERDFFPNILDKHCYGYVTGSEVLDIGTPERYEEVKKRIIKTEESARPKLKIAFLDRDGVINIKQPEGHYVSSIAQFEFTSGIFKLLQYLVASGFKFIIVTNQRGVAKGVLSEDSLSVIHGHMKTELQKKGIEILDIYYCPHNKDECFCRKPKSGMLEKSFNEHNIDLTESILISDSIADIEMGNAFGIGKSVLIETDNPESFFNHRPSKNSS